MEKPKKICYNLDQQTILICEWVDLEVAIMVNIAILREMHKLCSLYEKRWGREVDFIGMPDNLSQEKLLQVMRIIAETGDSVMVGFQKRKALVNPYFDYIENYHMSHDIRNGFVFDKPCPLCNNRVVYREVGNSYAYECQTENCFVARFRGI